MQLIKKHTTVLNEKMDRFWRAWGYECRVLARKYPQLSAERQTTGASKGAWVVLGPYAGVIAFKDLAVQAANHLGFTGPYESAVQFYLDELQGDHIFRPTPKHEQKQEDTLAIITRTDGSREAFRGRQKVG